MFSKIQNVKSNVYIHLSVKSLDHHRKDSFVCVILSHGRDGHIRSSDNEDVPLLEIIEPVKSCESLIGKPKLFFVQVILLISKRKI